MCLIYLNPEVSAQLDGKQLKGESKRIKKRLVQFATEANENNPGALDETSCHIKRTPDPLKAIRKKEFGRHRVYYIGAFRDCRYDVMYIKPFKKSGIDDDDDQSFQKRLINLLSNNDNKNNVLLESPKNNLSA